MELNQFFKTKFLLLIFLIILSLGKGNQINKEQRVLAEQGDISSLTSSIILNDNIQLHYEITDTEIILMVEATKYGWVGVGFSSTMFNTDMVIFETENLQAKVTDHFSEGQQTPSEDAQQDWTILGSDIQNDSFKIKAKRLLETGDTKDKDLQQGEEYTFCSAWSQSRQLEYHEGHVSYKIQLINSLGTQDVLVVKTGASEDVLKAHKYFLFYGWGIGVDISIFIVRYLKTWKHYINVHAFLFFLLNVGTIVVVALVIDENKDKLETPDKLDKDIMNHFIIGCTILAIVILQHLGGIFLKFSIEGTIKRVQSIKKLHQICGIILYILVKANLIIGSELDQTKNDGIIITVVSISFLLFAEIINRTYKHKTSHKVFDYVSVKAMNKYKDKAPSGQQAELLNMLNEEKLDIQQIIDALPSIKWIVYNQGVYDITNFIHPGGQFIMKEIVGREIGRYIIGELPLEGYNFTPHKHSYSAIQILKKNLIGYLNYGKTNIFEIEGEKDSPELHQAKLRLYMPFQITQVSKISDTTSKFYFQSHEVKIKNVLKGVHWFGRHFSVKESNDSKCRLYTQLNCMTDDNINFRSQLISYAKNVISGEQPNEINPDHFNKYTSTLPLIIKKYNFKGALSKTIHDESSSKNYQIQGPLGTGLDFGEYTKNQRICIFCVGTGLLPFLDLFDFLLKKQLQESLPNHKKQLDPFQIDYNRYFTGCQFTVYTGFVCLEDFIGKEWIIYLNQLSKQSGKDFFNLFVKLSKGQLQDDITRITERSYGDYIMKNIDKSMYDKVYICGTPLMYIQVMKCLKKKGFNSKNIFIV